MGDGVTWLVDTEATEVESAALAENLVQALIVAGYVSSEAGDNVLYRDALGYPPGPNAYSAVDESERERDRRRRFPLSAMRTNGVLVLAERRVFDSGGNTEGPWMRCPACSARAELEVYASHIDEWVNRTGPAVVECPECGVATALQTWEGELAFGNLGLGFFNWGLLSGEFVGWVRRQLGGHRVHVLVSRI
jgi:hypothetical protein